MNLQLYCVSSVCSFPLLFDFLSAGLLLMQLALIGTLILFPFALGTQSIRHHAYKSGWPAGCGRLLVCRARCTLEKMCYFYLVSLEVLYKDCFILKLVR